MRFVRQYPNRKFVSVSIGISDSLIKTQGKYFRISFWKNETGHPNCSGWPVLAIVGDGSLRQSRFRRDRVNVMPVVVRLDDLHIESMSNQ